MSAIIAFFVLALVLSLSLVVGAGWLAIIPALAVVAAVVWMVMVFAKGRSPGREVKRAPEPELLGPGGPDDPR